MIVSQSFFARRVWVIGHHYRPVVILACTFFLLQLEFFADFRTRRRPSSASRLVFKPRVERAVTTRLAEAPPPSSNGRSSTSSRPSPSGNAFVLFPPLQAITTRSDSPRQGVRGLSTGWKAFGKDRNHVGPSRYKNLAFCT
ncbi:hypothetical protein OH77DRAFT_1316330 [Trametes cingulata]|nr:hypothetical protein OH77DRAFT_1316330 [Trametes cingulata]